ncbi:MAG: sulfur oxidation c-type cytochrome SoxA [Pseudomonadota bacterium]
MNQIFKKLIMVGFATSMSIAANASPQTDVEAFKNYFTKKFPKVEIAEYANGVYAIDPVGRESWEAIEDFPPYEPFIDDGQAMWDKTFENGKSYKSCFPEGPAIAQNYPRWDKNIKMVVTLPLALNQCLKANGEKPMKYKKGSINKILSYIAFESRGHKVNIVVPTDDAGAVAAYEEGKKFYFTRRGQLNFSCATCHLQNAGKKLRSDTLSPAYGHPTGFPVYRSKWGTVGTLHRRFTGCNKQVRAKPFKAQGREYRNLEYFLTTMSNGLELNGPSSRK